MTSISRPRIAIAALVALGGCGATYVCFDQGGWLAGSAALISVLLALVLVLQPSWDELSAWSSLALMLLPGVLVVYTGFNAGGSFPDTPGIVAALLIAILVIRVVAVERPFAGFTPALAVAAGALALLAGWTLLSATWSDATSRGLIEFDRTLCYLLALVLFGSIPRTSQRVGWLVRGLLIGIAVVCFTGLATRVAPDVFPAPADYAANRLSYPVTYWNALGLLASLGIVLAFHLTSTSREHPAVRVLAATLVPPLACTLLFTFSRGAIAAAVLGLAAYAVIGRPRALVSGLLATVVPTVIAVMDAYDADLLASSDPSSAAAAAQGHGVVRTIGVCVALAAALRLVLLLLDRRLVSLRLPARARRVALPLVLVVMGGMVVAGALALDVPGEVKRQYDIFVERDAPRVTDGDQRDRLLDPSNSGRIDHWHVALDGYRSARLHGTGAGTFQTLWALDRPTPGPVADAHSLYVETLGELGIVGLLLLLATVMTLLAGLALRARGGPRSLYAALFAVGLTWAARAGIDWDWEMPVVTLWLFAAGGAALAVSTAKPGLNWAPRRGRWALAGALILLAIIPVRIALADAYLTESVSSFYDGDCKLAREAAAASTSAMGSRPEPYQVIGYCDMQERRARDAIAPLGEAVRLDPDNWELHYSLALARILAGADATQEIRAAVRLAPREEVVRLLAAQSRNRSSARRFARAATRRDDVYFTWAGQ